MATALIVDESDNTLVELSRIFREKGFSTETSQSFSATREALLRRMPEVAMLNETVDGLSTLDLLLQLDISRIVEIYLMSDEPSLESAQKAMRIGVSDYFRKPVDTDRLAENLDELSREADAGTSDDQAQYESVEALLIGQSPPMQRLRRLIRKVAATDASILIAGESGTGKELVAQSIHALSDRAQGRFVAMNCSAIAPELLESELFGHVKGSFTGATRNHAGIFRRADGGTLFLDEFTELEPPLQAKLLRVIETQTVTPVGGDSEKSVDVRIVSATNRDPQAAIDEGLLREDLYFRLAQFPLRVPPLRERSSDIEQLTQHFLEEQINSQGIEKTMSEEVIDVLSLHDWPGNVRELRNTIIHGFLLAGREISAEDLPDHLPQNGAQRGQNIGKQIGLTLAEVERRHILATLAHFGGDRKQTAQALNISRRTLYNKLKRYKEST